MRKLVFILSLIFSLSMMGQENTKHIPQVNVSGEGKIKITPDIAIVNIGIQNNGKDAKEVKALNDAVIDKLLKYIKQNNIPTSDYQTSQMNLFQNYDYEKKKNFFQANQSVTITLKDISKYNVFMSGVMETGVNTINGVEFKSSKIEQLESEARKKAILNAKKKAEDYVSVLEGQKVGKAIMISDNSFTNYPQPVMMAKSIEMADGAGIRETLAVGEIEIICNVQVSFMLD